MRFYSESTFFSPKTISCCPHSEYSGSVFLIMIQLVNLSNFPIMKAPLEVQIPASAVLLHVEDFIYRHIFSCYQVKQRFEFFSYAASICPNICPKLLSFGYCPVQTVPSLFPITQYKIDFHISTSWLLLTKPIDHSPSPSRYFDLMIILH